MTFQGIDIRPQNYGTDKSCTKFFIHKIILQYIAAMAKYGCHLPWFSRFATAVEIWMPAFNFKTALWWAWHKPSLASLDSHTQLTHHLLWSSTLEKPKSTWFPYLHCRGTSITAQKGMFGISVAHLSTEWPPFKVLRFWQCAFETLEWDLIRQQPMNIEWLQPTEYYCHQKIFKPPF